MVGTGVGMGGRDVLVAGTVATRAEVVVVEVALLRIATTLRMQQPMSKRMAAVIMPTVFDIEEPLHGFLAVYHAEVER